MNQKKDVGESHRCCSRICSLHPANMSDKPRMYQGVRVKTTVKELLQRHRAREADNNTLKTVSQSVDIQSLCVGLSTIQNHYVDAAAVQTDAAYTVQAPGSVFNNHPYVDLIMPGNGYSSDIAHCGSPSVLPPSGCAALPCSQGHLSPDAGYYGMAPSSSPDSLTFPSLVDHNSYSPQESYSSSSSSSCYDSPTRMDASFQGFPAEHLHHQHCTFHDGYCQPHCWPGQQEGFCGTAASYYVPTDYSCAYPAEENYFRSSEMCYNIL